jgi:hypothetical protein
MHPETETETLDCSPGVSRTRFAAYFTPEGALHNIAVDASLLDDCKEAGIDLPRELGTLLSAYAAQHRVTLTSSGRYMWKSCLGLGKEAVVQRILKEEIARRLKGEAAQPTQTSQEVQP